ncbi:hypothetical protein BB561_004453 [Smittium simulii]|uniref:Uncharacterized protein n=1 Tax=Smittium simulii TaxID=133385 RepID=A0A2T9YG68_9FUNG|nr:hypothetical protein BB561_004453 [Smittium simulii]
MFDFKSIIEPINGFQISGPSIRLVDHWDSQPAKEARDFYEKEIPKGSNSIVTCRTCKMSVCQEMRIINYRNRQRPTFKCKHCATPTSPSHFLELYRDRKILLLEDEVEKPIVIERPFGMSLKRHLEQQKLDNKENKRTKIITGLNKKPPVAQRKPLSTTEILQELNKENALEPVIITGFPTEVVRESKNYLRDQPINGFQISGPSIRLVDHWDSQPAKEARDFYEKEIPKGSNSIVYCRTCKMSVCQDMRIINYRNRLKPTFKCKHCETPTSPSHFLELYRDRKILLLEDMVEKPIISERPFGMSSKRHLDHQILINKKHKRTKQLTDYNKNTPAATQKPKSSTDLLLGLNKENALESVIITGFPTEVVRESKTYLRDRGINNYDIYDSKRKADGTFEFLVPSNKLENFKGKIRKIESLKIITISELFDKIKDHEYEKNAIKRYIAQKKKIVMMEEYNKNKEEMIYKSNFDNKVRMNKKH